MPIEAFGEEQAGLGVAAKDARETVDAVIR
jgi:hypothetical protein